MASQQVEDGKSSSKDALECRGWLITFSYRPCYKRRSSEGGWQIMDLQQSTICTKEHPAKYIASMRRKVAEMQADPTLAIGARVDQFETLHCAVAFKEGDHVSEDDVDLLS